MNYTGHNLRTNLQEWKNRVARSTFTSFESQVQYLFQNIEKTPQLIGIITEAVNRYRHNEEELDKFLNQLRGGDYISFESEMDNAAFNYQIIKHFNKKHSNYQLHRYQPFSRSNFEDSKSRIIDEFISPIINYLHDQLDESNSVIFLLEKYKRRTEWFTGKDLFNKYNTAEKNYEQILEDDLRLFLFDQGIDYPFSTPSSRSGRADIVGEIETDDPLIIEIKILDSTKGYGKDRIVKGFSQIVKYAEDYGKNCGYLVIYNMDKIEINFDLGTGVKAFPPAITYNHKQYYFVIVNCADVNTASKVGRLKALSITADELISEIGEG